MFTKRVEVTRYYACDGKEFAHEDVCSSYEKALLVKLDIEIENKNIEISKLKFEKNKTRLQFLISKCDAFNALYGGRNRIKYHEKMAEYHKGKVDYRVLELKLKDARKNINILYNKAYEWFGTHKHKSNLAKIERRKKSLRWRRDNTPDKWRTPNKIRVSKQPKEVGDEQ